MGSERAVDLGEKKSGFFEVERNVVGLGVWEETQIRGIEVDMVSGVSGVPGVPECAARGDTDGATRSSRPPPKGPSGPVTDQMNVLINTFAFSCSYAKRESSMRTRSTRGFDAI